VVQQQFLEVLDRDEAEARWRRVIDISALPPEVVPLAEALGRVLADDIRADVDVPGSTARTWTASRCGPETRTGRWRRSRCSCG
jgi:hypothetical protein